METRVRTIKKKIKKRFYFHSTGSYHVYYIYFT